MCDFLDGGHVFFNTENNFCEFCKLVTRLWAIWLPQRAKRRKQSQLARRNGYKQV